MLKPADRDGPAGDRPLGELLGQLLDDGRTYAEAEAELLKARAFAEADRYRPAALFAGIGAAFGLAAIVAFAIALIVGLSVFMGPLAASLLALVVLALAAGLLFAAARRAIAHPPAVGESDDS
jgi:hypothetical protein